jgi:hypothetical protein
MHQVRVGRSTNRAGYHLRQPELDIPVASVQGCSGRKIVSRVMHAQVPATQWCDAQMLVLM